MVVNAEFYELMVCYGVECFGVLNVFWFPAESHRTKGLFKY